MDLAPANPAPDRAPAPPEPGPLALVGSGEFLPVMAATDAALLGGRPARVAVLPTAAGQEGPARIRYWFDLAHAHYSSLGVEVVEVPVFDRRSADDPDHADLIAGAGLIYLSGGDPHHVTATLAGTVVWAAIRAAWQGGAALAGCSAGAMTLAGRVASIRSSVLLDGLGVVPGVCVLPHFDRLRATYPDLAVRVRAEVGATVVGIDENTALVGAAAQGWRVEGRGEVHVFATEGEPARYAKGSTVPALTP
jgi:cyanophycinase